MPVDIDRARAAKERVKDLLAGRSQNVNGIGLTRVGEDFAVKVNLGRPDDLAMPETIDGVPIVVELVGAISKRTPRG